MNILFVENHPVFAKTVIGQFLSQHTLTIAPSLTDARRAMETGKFDLLLIDFDLDDGKGDGRGRRGSGLQTSWHSSEHTRSLSSGSPGSDSTWNPPIQLTVFQT